MTDYVDRIVHGRRRLATAAALVGALCSVAPAAAQDAGRQQTVTFSKDIAPIFQRSCVSCHREGAIAPMSLRTYADARPWARSIKQRVVSREMPPWGLDRNTGIQHIKNDPTLTDEEIELVSAWVDSGAPAGDPKDMPPQRQFDDHGWTLDTPPDLVVEMPVDYEVKATGPDEKPNFIADFVMPEDRYIRAVQTKPNAQSFRVVHHSNTNVILPDGTSDFLNEYSIGKGAEVFPEGSGRLLPEGSQIEFDVHYHSIGETVQSRSAVAFWFYPKGVVPKYPMHTQHVGENLDVDIRANEISRHDGYFRLPKPALITAFQPHTHIRGKRQCVEAIFPDLGGDDNRPEPARVETISCVNINFGWMMTYNFEDDYAPLLPAGTVLHMITWHDNTTANKNNPNPKNWVGRGGRTTDEMNFGWMNMYFLDEADYQQRVRERAAKRAALSDNQ